MSNFVTLGDALTSYLNDPARGFSQSFTASRVALPIWNLEKISGLTVEVFPSSESRERASRVAWATLMTVGIAVRKRAKTVGEIDAILVLLKEIKDAICKLQSVDGNSLVAVADAEPFEPELLAQEFVFSHAIVATFRSEDEF